MAKAGETPSNDEELLQEIREFAKKSNAELGTDLARVVSDLEFEGGAQFEASDDALRGPGRAKVIFNFTRNYCNSLINTFRNKPYGIILDARTGDGVDKATVTQGIIRGIESKCDAVGAYTVAVDRQIKGGRGYCVVTSDYSSEDGWDQEIKIQSVIPDPVTKGQIIKVGDPEPSVKLVVQNALVLGTLLPPVTAQASPTPAPSGPPSGASQQPTSLNGQSEMVLVAVTANQAEVIRYAQLYADPAAGDNISLVLRSPKDYIQVDASGNPVLDANGNPVIVVPPLDRTDGVVLRTLIDKYLVLPPDILNNTK